MKLREWTAIAMLACVVSAAAQESTDTIGGRRRFFLMTKGEVGRIAQTNDFVRGTNLARREMHNFNAFSLGFGWQTTGRHEWEHIHNFPAFGFGIYKPHFENCCEIGHPFSLYAFYRGTLWRNGNHSLHYNIDGGWAFGWKRYDLETNPYNVAVGTNNSVHISAGAEYDYTFDKKLHLGVGLNVSHFSNGCMRKPNKGLNTLSPYVRVIYEFEQPEKLIARRRADFGRMKGNEIALTVGAGFKRDQYNEIWGDGYLHDLYQDTPRYFITSLQAAYLRQYGHMGKYGCGLSIIYNDWIGSTLRIENYKAVGYERTSFARRMMYALFMQHEFCIDKLSVVAQLGVNVWHARHISQDVSWFYQRLGLKYVLPWNQFIGANIYAQYCSQAVFVEWNMGYTLPWGQHVKYMNNN